MKFWNCKFGYWNVCLCIGGCCGGSKLSVCLCFGKEKLVRVWWVNRYVVYYVYWCGRGEIYMYLMFKCVLFVGVIGFIGEYLLDWILSELILVKVIVFVCKVLVEYLWLDNLVGLLVELLL